MCVRVVCALVNAVPLSVPRAAMLSRLSGLAKGVNSVLQELSGDGEEPPEHESEVSGIHRNL